MMCASQLELGIFNQNLVPGAGNLRMEAPSNFHFDHEMAIVAVTEGHFAQEGNITRAGSGVCFGIQHPFNVGRPLIWKPPSRERTELQSVYDAIVRTMQTGYGRLHIISASQYVVDCMNQHVITWANNNWMRQDGVPVYHRNELMEILRLSQNLSVKYEFAGYVETNWTREARYLAQIGALYYS